MIEKDTHYANKKLLAAARDQECMLEIPGVCKGNTSTVVAAHSNWSEHGRGMHHKAHDCFICFACADCHYWLDYGKDASRHEKRDAFYRGMSRTLLNLLRRGVLK